MDQTEFLKLNKPSGTGNLDFVNDDKFWKENPDKIDAAIKSLNDLTRFEALGVAALILKDSLYLKNDANLFGYKSDGTYTNIATVEDSNVTRFGDVNIVAWLMSKDYLSIRTPRIELIEQVDSSYNAITPSRTVYHSGNHTNHAILHSTTGTQSLTQNTKNKLSILDNLISAFPSGSAVTGTGQYTIPRNGVYVVNYTVRPIALTLASSVIRCGLSRVRSGSTTELDMQDIVLSNAYASGFYGGSFVYTFNKDDVVSPWFNPLNENITIQAGTKFNIYYLGDNPSA